MALSDLFLLGFFIGLTGAMAPGPTLIATIQNSLHFGWVSGPRVTLGHVIAEFFVVLLIATGISVIPQGTNPLISIFGGIALCIFGYMTITGAREAELNVSEDHKIQSTPEVAGLITSVTNPYFWIWWLSVGSALLISSLSLGISGLVAFITGHWLADLSWFTFVSFGVHRSRKVFKTHTYRLILIICGLLLVAFGLWFAIGGILPLFNE
jgi:threonine/homoserine/homoserine lactone efflux protein